MTAAPQNGTQAHDLSRELGFADRLRSALPRFGMPPSGASRCSAPRSPHHIRQRNNKQQK